MKTSLTQSQISATTASTPTLHQSEMMAAANALGQAQRVFTASASGSSGPTRTLLACIADWFDVMLPAATGEMKHALVELCAMETARAHLEREADAGRLGTAQILDVGEPVAKTGKLKPKSRDSIPGKLVSKPEPSKSKTDGAVAPPRPTKK